VAGGLSGDGARAPSWRERLLHARRPKDEHEIALLRKAAPPLGGLQGAVAPSAAGVSERELQIELELFVLRAGADRTGYSSIVGIGSHAGVLHFAPGARRAEPGDVVLGRRRPPEVQRYTADVTRTYRLPGGDDGFFRAAAPPVVQNVEQNAHRPLPAGGRVARDPPGGGTRDRRRPGRPGAPRRSPESRSNATRRRSSSAPGIGHMVGPRRARRERLPAGARAATGRGATCCRTDLRSRRATQ